MNHPQHISRSYDAELRHVRERIAHMGQRVEAMIESSVAALARQDATRTQRTIEADREVDQLELEIDRLCLSVLARRQPVASDLRMLAASMKLVKDLERIGDCARHIAVRVLGLLGEPRLDAWSELLAMSEAVREMVREAIEAFLSADAARAEHMIELDHAVDAYYARIGQALLAPMAREPLNIALGVEYHAIAKSLERIGDHAKNVGEMVVFMVRGTDIRHGGPALARN